MKKQTYRTAQDYVLKIEGLQKLTGSKLIPEEISSIELAVCQKNRNFKINDTYTLLGEVPGLQESISRRLHECAEMIQMDLDNAIGDLQKKFDFLQDSTDQE